MRTRTARLCASLIALAAFGCSETPPPASPTPAPAATPAKAGAAKTVGRARPQPRKGTQGLQLGPDGVVD